MTKIRSDRRTRGGFTLAEVVVALAVIVIVTAAAMTLISSQLTLELETIQTVEAANIAENAIECFRFTKKHTNIEFENLFRSVTGADEADENGYYPCELNGTTYKVLFAIDNNTITVTVSLDGGEPRHIAFAPYKVKFRNVEAGDHKIDIKLYLPRTNSFSSVHLTDEKWGYRSPGSYRTSGDLWSYEYQLFREGLTSSPWVHEITYEQI